MTAIPPPPPPPVAAQPGATPAKSSGCWKWGACGCITALIIVAAGIAGIVLIVFGMVKSSDVYAGARREAARDPRVIEALGAPVHAGWWVTGSVHVDNGEGNADFHFPLIGSKSRGQVHAVATRDNGAWHYSELTVTTRDGQTIDVLSP